VYGSDRVANVATFGTEKSKSAILTACRGLGIDVDIAQYLASMIVADRGLLRTLSQTFYGDEENGYAPNKQFVTEMTEKSPTPATNWCCPPFYYYTREDAKLVKVGIDEGCGTDAPGSYIAWLCKRSAVYAMQMPGKRYDIGTVESYEQVKKEYKGIC
jgi:hypothetical protein